MCTIFSKFFSSAGKLAKLKITKKAITDLELSLYYDSHHCKAEHKDLIDTVAILFVRFQANIAPGEILKNGIHLLKVMRNEYVTNNVRLESLEDRLDKLDSDEPPIFKRLTSKLK